MSRLTGNSKAAPLPKGTCIGNVVVYFVSFNYHYSNNTIFLPGIQPEQMV